MTDEHTTKGLPKPPRPPSLTPPSPPPPSDPQRRVYALPQEMVDRIVEFQKEKGLPSEVEAVRRLLDEALKSRDNLGSLINRFLSRLSVHRVLSEAARDVLVGHPLVRSVTFETSEWGDSSMEYIRFMLKNGTGAEITENGDVALAGDKTKGWKWKKGEGMFAAGKLDDVPF